MPRGRERKITAFEKNEQDKIVRFCIESRRKNHMGIIICLFTGIRLGELLALTWQDVDFHRRMLHINKTLVNIQVDGKYKLIADSPKTNTSIRIIPLAASLISLLKKLKRNSISDYVLANKFGGMLDPRSYQRAYKRVLNRIGIPYKNFHALRHTFATRALELGMDVKTVSDILGHKSPTVTLVRYAHSLLTYKANMMNKLGKMLEFDDIKPNPKYNAVNFIGTSLPSQNSKKS